jgi:hypothetical protein
VPPPPPNQKSTPTGAIAGGVVGGVAVIAGVVAAIFFFLRRDRKKKEAGAAAVDPNSGGAVGPTVVPSGPTSPQYEDPNKTGAWVNDASHPSGGYFVPAGTAPQMQQNASPQWGVSPPTTQQPGYQNYDPNAQYTGAAAVAGYPNRDQTTSPGALSQGSEQRFSTAGTVANHGDGQVSPGQGVAYPAGGAYAGNAGQGYVPPPHGVAEMQANMNQGPWRGDTYEVEGSQPAR